MTHDSIGLGEDGPTHQPVEHLAALRAMPGLYGVPPGRRGRDRRMLGTWRCDQRARAVAPGADPPGAAAAARTTPARRTARRSGAYVLAEADGARQVTLLATGSEVSIAMAARDAAGAKDGIRAAVVSMPCWELFERAGRGLSRPACSAARRGSGSRPRCDSAGTAGSARDGALSACTVSAPRRPARRSTRISASPPRRSPQAARALL